MASAELSGLYHQYKDGTKTVTTYLVTTSKARGFPVNHVLKHGSVVTAAPLKNLAASKAKTRKASAVAKPTTHSPSAVNALRVKVDGLIQMAEFLVSLDDPPLQVPRGMFKVLNDVIKFRNAFSNLLRSTRTSESEVEGDQSHAHFVAVLEQVRSILAVRVARSSKRPRGEVTHGQPSRNQFERLSMQTSVEETSEDEDEDAVPPSVSLAREVYLPEVENRSTEQLLAYFALLQEFVRLREEVSLHWIKYRDNECDLAVAALATEAAVSLARTLEDAIPEKLQYAGNPYELIASAFSNHHADGVSSTVQKTDHPLTRDFQASSCADDPLMRKAHKVMQVSLTMYKLGMYGTGNGHQRKKKRTLNDRFSEPLTATDIQELEEGVDGEEAKQLHLLLMEYICPLSMEAPDTQHLVTDGLLFAMNHILENEKIPLWSALAADLCMCAMRTLNGNVSRPFSQLLEYTRTMISSFKSFASEKKKHGCVFYQHLEPFLKSGTIYIQAWAFEPTASAGAPDEDTSRFETAAEEDLDFVTSFWTLRSLYLDGEPPKTTEKCAELFARTIFKDIRERCQKRWREDMFDARAPGAPMEQALNCFNKQLISMLFRGHKFPSAKDLAGEAFSALLDMHDPVGGARRGKHKKRTTRRVPVELVRAVAGAIAVEVSTLAFNYFEFQEQVAVIFTRLHSLVNDAPDRKEAGCTCALREGYGIHVVHGLMVAASTGKSREVMAKAAEIFSQWLEEIGGDGLIQKANRMNGVAPEEPLAED